MNEFDILIGVDMSDAESKIQSSLKKIGKDYPIEVSLILSNESEFIKDIQAIKKLIGNLEKIDVDLGLSESLKNAKSESEKMAKQLIDNMNKVKKGANDYNDEIEEGNRLLKTQIRLIKEKDGSTRKIVKKTEGVPNNNTTTTTVNGIPTGETVQNINQEKERTEQLRLQKMILDQHHKTEEKILSLEREGIAHHQSIKKLKNLNKELYTMEIDDLTKIEKKLDEISKQHAKINNQIKDKKFENAKNNAFKDIKKKADNKLDANLMGDDLVSLDKKLNSIANAKNYTYLESAIVNATNAYDGLLKKQKELNDMATFKKTVTNDRMKELEDEAKELNRRMNERAKIVQKNLDDEAKFINQRDKAEAEEARKRAEVESKQLNADAEAIIKNREKYYKEQEDLMLKQYQDEEKFKKAWKQSLLDRAEEEAKEVNRLHNIQAQAKQNELDSMEAFREQRSKAEKKEADDRVKAKEAELERLKKQQEKHVADQRKAEEDLANQIGAFNEKSVASSRKRESDMDDAQYRAIAKESERIMSNQLRINDATKEWDKQIDELKSQGFIDESDLIRARQLIAGLSRDSEKLEQELREVKNALKSVENVSSTRKGTKEKVKQNNDSSSQRLAELERQGNIPTSMIDNYKSLNGMLDFKSDANDIRIVNQELKRMEELNKDIAQARKMNQQYDDKIVKAMEQQVKAIDKQNDAVDKVILSNKDKMKSDEKIVKLKGEESELEQRISQYNENLTSEQKIQKTHLESQLKTVREILSNDDSRKGFQSELAELQRKINSHSEKGRQLKYEETREIQKQIEEIKRKISAQTQLEAKLQNEARIREQLRRQVTSDTYRAGRGLDNNPDERNEINRQADVIRGQLDGLNNLTGDDFDRKVADIRNSLDGLNQDSQRFRNEIRDDANSIVGQLGNAMRKVPIWMGAMGLFYSALNQVTLGFQSLIEYDTAMTNLKKVTEASTAELEHFKEVSHSLGMDLGVTASQVVTATTEFQKIGFNLQESAQLGKASLLYANVGDMSVDKAQQNVISAVKGFNLELDASGREATKLIDIFNEVSNNYAISAEGIGEALRRSSAVLSEAGNSVEQSVALVTSANTTIQDPERVGTALKTVSMRLRGVSEEGETITQLVPEIESSLVSINEKLGLVGEEALTLKKDENTFLSTFEMFDKISKQWDNLTDMERANLVELIGGKEQGAIVSSMINNWSDATNSYETALNSAGSAQREFIAYTDSFEYKIGRLKSAMEGFWQAFVNDDAVKSAIDSLTGMVVALTKLSEMNIYGGLAMVSQLVAMVALLASKKLRTAVLGVTALGASLSGLVGFLKSIAMRIPVIGQFLLIAYGVGKAIEGIYHVLTAEARARQGRIDALNDEISALEELKQANEELDKSYGENEGKSFGSGVKKFGELRDKGSSRTTEEEVEYNNMAEKMEESMPQFIAYYDEYGNAIFKSTEKMQSLNNELERNISLKKQALLEEEVEDADFGDLQKKVDKAKKIYKDMKDNMEYSDEYSQSKAWIKKEIEGMDVGTKEYKKKVEEFSNTLPYYMKNLSQTKDIEKALNEGKSSGLRKVDAVINQIEEANSALSSELKSAKNDVTLEADEYKRHLETAFELALQDSDIKPDTNEYLLADKLHQYMADNLEMFNEEDISKLLNPDKISDMLTDALKDIEGVELSVDDLFNINSGNGEKTAEAIQKVIDKLEHNGGSSWLITTLQQLRKEHLETANQLNNTEIRPFNFNTEVIPVIDSFENSILGLDSAYRTLAEGQALSSTQVFELIRSYPELTKSLQVHNGQLKINGNAIKELAKIKEQEFRNELKISRQKAVNARADALTKIKSIKAQIQAIQLLSKAEAKANSVRIKTTESVTENRFGVSLNNKLNTVPSLVDTLKNKESQDSAKKGGSLTTTLKTVEQEVADLGSEIRAIDALMGADFSSNLGGIADTSPIGGSGGSSAKDKAKDTAKQLSDAIYVADKYSQKMNEINQLIERQQLVRERYASGSSAYNKTISEEINLLNQKKSAIDGEIKSLENQIRKKQITQYGIISVGEEDNSTARKKSAELQQEIDEAKERLSSLRTESVQVFNEIKQVRYSYVESVLESYEKQREQWSDDIAYAEYSKSLYSEKTDAYRQAMREQESYLKKQLQLHASELAYLEQQAKANKELTAKQKDDLNGLIRERREAIYSLKEELQEFNMLMIQSKQSVYSSDREQWSDDIAYTEYMKDLFLDTAEGYRKWSREKEGLIKKQLELQQQELKMLEIEKQTNKSLTNAQSEELNGLIRDARKEVYELSSELISIQADIATSRLDEALSYMESESNAYAEKIEEINNKMKYEINEEDYHKEVEYLQQIASLRKGEIADIQANIAKLKALYAENIDNVHVAEEISNEIKNWERNLISAQNSLADLSLDIKNVYEELANEYVELYKEQLELMRKADEEYYKNKLDAESKAHESRMNQIEREMDALSKAYDLATKAIDRESSTKAYNDKMNELKTEALELKKQIDILSLDDSYEAKKKKSELVKKLTQIEMDMADEQYDRTNTLRKESLEDALATEEEMLENKKNAYEEEYDAWVEMMEKRAEEKEKYWQGELSNERKFAEMRTEILEGNFDEIISIMKDWIDDIEDNMSLVGESVENNLIYKIEEAIKKFQELSSLDFKNISDAISSSVATNLDGEEVNQSHTGEKTDGSIVNNNGTEYKTPETITKEEGEKTSEKAKEEVVKKGRLKTGTFAKKADAELIAKNMKTSYKANKNYVEQDGKLWRAVGEFDTVERANKVLTDMKKLKKIGVGYVSAFKTGGYTGEWNGEQGKLALLHQKELVLNAEQTKDILNTAKVVENLKNILPRLNMINPNIKQNNGDSSQTTNNEYNLTLQIESMTGNKRDAERVSEQIINNLKRTKGGRF